MNSLTNIEKFLSPNIEEISIYGLIFNLVIGLFLSLVIKKFYKLYGNSTSNRGEFSKIFPLITLVTILVISVVKSSLALSLGLVGALSIVRFRTPIRFLVFFNSYRIRSWSKPNFNDNGIRNNNFNYTFHYKKNSK